MNRPKTSAHHISHRISDDCFFASTVSPKPRHTVSVTQVDTFIRTTCEKVIHRFQACLPSCLRHRFSDLGLRRSWIWFSEHSNRPIDVERLVPPEEVNQEIHGRIRERHDFEMGEWKVFEAPCNALRYEPRRLEQDKRFSEPAALRLVLDFLLGRYEEWLVIITRAEIHLPQRIEGFIIFWRYLRLFGATLKKMEPSHYNKESVRYRPLYI